MDTQTNAAPRPQEQRVESIPTRSQAEIAEFERRCQATLAGHTGDIVARSYDYEP